MAALLALLAATLLGGPVTAAAGSSLAFSHVYGDGMVLQMAPHAASVAKTGDEDLEHHVCDCEA